MIVSILGTRGGIGSTTLLSNLFELYKEDGVNSCWLSLTPPFPPLFSQKDFNWEKIFSIKRNIPVWDKNKCNYCNKCVLLCVYNAIEHYHNEYKFHSESCNSCKLCVDCCEQRALNFELLELGEMYANLTSNNNMLKLKLNEKELISEWHISNIFSFLKKYFNKNEICFVDISSGYKELWSEFFKLSDIVILYTDDTIVWDLIYQSLSPRDAKLILAVTKSSYTEFIKSGYSYAIPVPYNKEIAISSIQGEIVKDLFFYNSLQSIKGIINETVTK